MPAIKNIDKAYKKINEESTKIPKGKYTLDVAIDLLEAAAKEFKLSKAKVEQLKEMEYDRELDKTIEDGSTQVKKLSLEEKVQAQDEQIKTLVLAVSKIATLTGYGNHLNEFNIDKWIPTKKDMSKKYD